MHFNSSQKGRIPPLVIDYLLRDGKFSPILVPRSRLLGREKGYKFNPSLREKVLQKLTIPRDKVSIDLFASHNDAQERLFCSEQNSAWEYNWHDLQEESAGGVLWVNPPFQDIKKVLTKASLEEFRLVLVIPLWKKAGWLDMLAQLKVREYVIPRGTPVFEKCPVKGILPQRYWGVSVCYIDTSQKNVSSDSLDPVLVQEIQDECRGLGISQLRQRCEEMLYRRPVMVRQIGPPRNDDKLVIDVWVELPSGRGQVLRALVDTGAEVNLVREGLFPKSEFSFAQTRLNLTMANGQLMRGGNLSFKVWLFFSRDQGQEFLEQCTIPAEFHEAYISVDVILVGQ
jgi:hypothetical protein